MGRAVNLLFQWTSIEGNRKNGVYEFMADIEEWSASQTDRYLMPQPEYSIHFVSLERHQEIKVGREPWGRGEWQVSATC